VEALRGVELDVAQGKFVALVGPSGCGKSTLLHIAAGLVEPDQGTVTVAGTPARAGRPDTAIMLQRPVMLPWRTIIANILLPIEIYGLDRREAMQRAAGLLHVVGLDGCEDKYPWELSGGMSQRASLVQSLVSNPAILLMDEPFSAVDEFTRERLNGELAKLHDELGRTTVFVTHNIFEAVFLADVVVAMRSRPGSIIDLVPIELPRPRTLELLKDNRELSDYAAHIRQILSAATEGSDTDGH
jgi:NitT/TauT family transport system ATP-binding protein